MTNDGTDTGERRDGLETVVEGFREPGETRAEAADRLRERLTSRVDGETATGQRDGGVAVRDSRSTVATSGLLGLPCLGTGIGSLSDTSPADGRVGETPHGDVESGFDFADTCETVSADDPDTDEDGYPVLQAIDRETQLAVRE